MNKLLFFLFLVISSQLSAQWEYYINFDSMNSFEQRIQIDTISNPDNIWQIGHPSGDVLNEAYSPVNAIMTDTLNSYPVNDTSSFIIRHVRWSDPSGSNDLGLKFWFKMEADSSSDYGMVEASVDMGESWINLMTEDEDYGFWWPDEKPSLTESTGDWERFNIVQPNWSLLKYILIG